ncbi:MAG: glutaredoxin family protein [Candidatus Thermoplasmatota archaeon]
MDKIKTVEGKNKGKIMLYALSTCVWCKKTKRLLDDLDVEYNYIFVDKLDGDKKEKIKKEIKKWNPKISFPTIVFNDKKCIVGYKKDEIKKALKG